MMMRGNTTYTTVATSRKFGWPLITWATKTNKKGLDMHEGTQIEA